MRSKYGFAICLAVISTQLGPLVGSAVAGLFSSISYNQYVSASPFNQLGTSRELMGTTLPVSQTLTLSDGGSAQATYNFTDNGTVAALSIVGSFNLPGQGQASGESTDNLTPTRFEFSQPVSYQILFQGTSSPNLSGGGLFHLYGAGGALLLSSSIQNSSWQSSGTLAANVGFFFEEQYQIANGPPGPVYLGSGTDSLSLTFTAIPEPSSLSLLALGGGCLLRRRRPAIAL